MRRVPAHLFLALIGSATLFASEVALETKTFSLRQVAAPDALTLLRTIFDVKQLEAIDDATVTATAPADRLLVAAQILSLVDGPEPVTQADTVADGSELVIAVAPLGGTSPGDAMRAMRELGVRKTVVVSVRDLVVIRDSEAQVKAELERLEDLRQPPPE